MAGITRHITALAVLTQLASAFNCSVEPLYVDIHKRAVHGTEEFQYGSFIGIGSPAQNQSIWPSLRQNETSFAGPNFCSQSSLANCNNATGGDFDPSQSTSWSSSSNESRLIAGNDGSFVAGKDTLHMYTHFFQTEPAWETNLRDAPVMIASSGTKSPGTVGMGSASTLLQRMVDVGMIAAKTYSLYIGTGFDRAGGIVNGSNTFGGYDSGRFKGEVHTYPMDLASPDYLPVTVADIIINDPTQGKISVMVEDETFTARITTDRYPMRLPFHVTQNFMSALGAAPSTSPDGSLQLARPFNGTVTIKLGDGFNVTLPASTMFNSSGLSPIENTSMEYSGPFYLSAAWLSQVYLMLDYEAAQFHLAQAIQFAPFIIPRTFCPRSIPVAHDYNGYARGLFSRAGLAGAVVGGVVGGIALIVLAWVLFVAWKRRQVKQEQDARWAAEEKAAAIKNEDVEMQAMTPATDGGFVEIPVKAYEPIRTGNGLAAEPTYAPVHTGDGIGMERAVSPVSQMSRASSVSSNGSRPASLRGQRI